MTQFDKREEGFEKKFALDEEQKFKAEVRRNKLLGQWAAEQLGMYRRCGYGLCQGSGLGRFRGSRRQRRAAQGAGDLTAKGVAITEAQIRVKMDELMATAGDAGEGGDVRTANREWRIANEGFFPFATRHSPFAVVPLNRARKISSNRRDAALKNPPRRVTTTTSWLALRSSTRMVAMRPTNEFFGSVTLGQQRDAEAGFDQAFLGGQAVDRRPVHLPQSVGLEQRKHMRGRDFAPPRRDGKCDPALVAQIGQFPDAAAGARVVRRAHDLKPLGKQHFAIEIARRIAVVTQPDRRLAAPDQVADLGAGRGAQRQLDVRTSLAKRFMMPDSCPPASVPTTASATGPESGRASARTAFSASWVAATARSA